MRLSVNGYLRSTVLNAIVQENVTPKNVLVNTAAGLVGGVEEREKKNSSASGIYQKASNELDCKCNSTSFL